MAAKPRARKKKRRIRSAEHGQIVGLRSQEVLSRTLDEMEDWVKLQRPDGSYYSARDILSVILYAAQRRTTIEDASSSLEDAPHSNTVRGATATLNVGDLEEELNRVLSCSLPRGLLSHPVESAIDLKLVCYYGEAKEGEEEFLLRGPARDGTTRFFGYASIYLIKKNKRFTLAVTVVRKSDDMLAPLERLLDRFFALGGEIRCLYLDREFYCVKVLDFLIHKKDIPLCMAAPKKGKEGGIKGLINKNPPGVYPYTVSSPKDGKINVSVAVVGMYLRGRHKKHGRRRYAFVIHRYPFSFLALFDKYRSRFGIECSHRIWEQARARTASQRATLRFLLVGTAILLHNLWILMLWCSISIPSQGGRKVLRKLFHFQRFLSFLESAIGRLYHLLEEVIPGHA